MNAIELKCWSISFQALKDGTKRFEYRKDDRPYAENVILWQREWNPDTGYTGDELYHDVMFIIRGGVFGIPEGYCIMSMSEPRSTPTPHSGFQSEQFSIVQDEDGYIEKRSIQSERVLDKLEKMFREARGCPYPTEDDNCPFPPKDCNECLADYIEELCKQEPE